MTINLDDLSRVIQDIESAIARDPRGEIETDSHKKAPTDEHEEDGNPFTSAQS